MVSGPFSAISRLGLSVWFGEEPTPIASDANVAGLRGRAYGRFVLVIGTAGESARHELLAFGYDVDD